MKVKANGIELEVEDSGAGQGDKPAVLLIMGLGVQLTFWPHQLIDAVVAAGYRAIRFDNRDIGKSQFFDSLGDPSLAWAATKLRLGLKVTPLYSLHDMAADALGVLDALGVTRAHVVGVSMGGMIAQRVAIAAPDRVTTLTSIMSTSSAPGLPAAKGELLRFLLKRAPTGRDAVLEHGLKLWQLLQGTSLRTPDDDLRTRLAAAYDRSYHPRGIDRQFLAILADSTRAFELQHVKAPTLVIHGTDDPLLPHACGEDTARRIAGSRLVSIQGMGHDFPPGGREQVIEALLPHLRSVPAVV
jgi:pimeloyl-ACP methyl ester carboxylesterase